MTLVRPAALAAALLGLLLSAALPADAGKKETREEKAAATPEPPKPEEKPFDEMVNGLEPVAGLFTFYRNSDEGKWLLELGPDQLDRVFLLAITAEQSTGERGFYSAMVLGDFPFYFHRVGKNVMLLQKNSSFTAQAGTPAARAVAHSFTDALMGSGKIVSQPHPQRKSVLVDANDFFLKDLPALAPALTQAYQPSNYTFDHDHSAIVGVKSFPQNALLEVWLHYQTDSPKMLSITLPDARSIPLRVKYDLSAIPETDYKPRLADDRVGHFITLQQDFTSDAPPEPPYRRVINRWDLRKPLVFWLENTIPVEYREAMEEGALLWNKAFARVGLKDAIEVRQQPDDAGWDPADTRYNTIRWFAGVDAAFAIGPSRANPFTGEIYDADIGFSDGIIRSIRRFGDEMLSPLLPGTGRPAWSMAGFRNGHASCDYADGLVAQAALAMSVLEARGEWTAAVEKRLLHEYLVSVTAHEVGHTLGLRHNFRASTILPPQDLANPREDEAQSSSVMDYNPVLIDGRGEGPAHFLPVDLGPYDYWAIEYAYEPIDGDEKAELAKIAARGAGDVRLPYATDEDAMGTFSPRSIDPLDNQYDASGDPLAYFEGRVGLVETLWSSMESRLARPGEGYQVLRRALMRGLVEYNRALLTTSKFVGGIYHYRDHVGDPGGRAPFVPVPAAKQREALAFLARHAFSAQAFVLPPSLLNRLAIEREPTLDANTYFSAPRLDYPWHDSVLALQAALLGRMLHPITLGRILDNELRFEKGAPVFRMVEVFDALDRALWSDLDRTSAAGASLRRNAQREHVNQLIRLVLRQPVPSEGGISPIAPPVPPSPIPEDATTLARASLVHIRGRIQQALGSAAVHDATTVAHWRETEARIEAVLDARVQRGF